MELVRAAASRGVRRALVSGLGFVVVAAALAVAAPGAERHLFYLHGRIVQDRQSARPVHPRFGPYELEAILDAFRERGFVVHGDIRPKDATIAESARRVVEEVRALHAAGVPADHIAVVGASMGATIGLVAAAELVEPEMRFAFVGGCYFEDVREFLPDPTKDPVGHLLFVRETSDALVPECPPWPAKPGRPQPAEVREITVSTGLEHGFLYRPLADWFEPVASWAAGGESGP